MRFTGRRKTPTEPAKPFPVKSQWTRWGRGNSEGYTFWLGDSVKGYVIRDESDSNVWLACSGQTELGRYDNRDAAMGRVEGESPRQSER